MKKVKSTIFDKILLEESKRIRTRKAWELFIFYFLNSHQSEINLRSVYENNKSKEESLFILDINSNNYFHIEICGNYFNVVFRCTCHQIFLIRFYFTDEILK